MDRVTTLIVIILAVLSGIGIGTVIALSIKSQTSEPIPADPLSKFQLVVENDMDFPGNDLPGGAVAGVNSASACAGLCLQSVGCKAFGYEGQLSKRTPNTCWLKTTLGVARNKFPQMSTYFMKS
jgi:hypothetical protein